MVNLGKKASYTLNYTPSKTFKKFHNDNSFVRGVRGPVGSGKSVACLMEIYIRALQQPPCKDGIRRSRWAVVRNTQPQLEATTFKTWIDWFPEEHFGKVKRSYPWTHTIRKPKDIELEVIFLPLDGDADVIKLMSLELTGIFFNEAVFLSKQVLDRATGRVGRFPKREDVVGGDFYSGIIMDTNPPTTRHWWYEYAEINTPKGWKFFSQPSGLSAEAENRQHLPDNYYERQMHGKDQNEIDVLIHGKYGVTKIGMPVYKSSFNEDIHCVKNLKVIPNTPIDIGIDFGNTAAAVITQKNPLGQRMVLQEFICYESTPLTLFAENLKKLLNEKYSTNPVTCYGDPAGNGRDQQGKTAFDLFRTAGLLVRPAPTNKPELRIEAVVKELTTLVNKVPAYVIDDDKCPVLKEGFNGGYYYKKLNVSGDELYEPSPEKNSLSSHVHDANQYVLCGTGSYNAIIYNKNVRTECFTIKNNFSVW